MAKTKIMKDIWVTTKNKVGALNTMIAGLAEAKVNVWAMCCWTEGENYTTMMITDNNAKATELIKGAGCTTKENEVVVTTLENKPGTIWDATQKIKGAGIDIKYLYVTTCGTCPSARIVMCTDNNTKTAEVLG